MIFSENIDFDIPCWYKPGGCPKACPQCERTCHRYLEMNVLINNCGMPNADRYLKGLSPEKVDLSAFGQLKLIKDNIMELVDTTEDGLQLFIGSINSHTGKTTWSLKLLYKYFDEVWCGNGFRIRGYFVFVPDFLQKMKDYNFKNTKEYKQLDEIIKTAKLVIWDNLVGDPLSPQDQTLLNMYIDRRLMYGLSNIYNGIVLQSEMLKINLGEKLFQRIENADQIIFKGASHKAK